MRIKLIDSAFDKNTGVSYAKIQTDCGVFQAFSELHEEDKHISSSFAGCQYAEIKATIKYMKYKIKLLKERIKALENCKKALENKKNYNHNSEENRTIRKQIYILKKDLSKWEQKTKSLHQHMISLMERREKIIKRMQKGDEK